MDGLYFALPTRTAATQIFRRVQQAIELAFSEKENRPPVVLAVPGYLAIDESQGKALPNFEVQWPDEHGDRFRWRAWAAEHPKRYLTGVIAVGTIDQVLLSTLEVKHSHFRAVALLRHLLVVDEVHASDTYMNQLLEEVLRRHLGAGGHAFLMSATLGSSTRYRFVNTGQRKVDFPSLEEAKNEHYPLITRRTLNGAINSRSIKVTESSKKVFLQTKSISTDYRSIVQIALQAASNGARVLVIRNTVGDCQKTQQALETEAGITNKYLFSCVKKPAPHHSRFSKDDRDQLDQSLEKYFGKDEKGGVVAIATQTVQQSLDIDADLLITDLCPMDVLLQRIGRLHRHGTRKRPQGFESAQVNLLVIEATWQCMEEKSPWEIPAMNRQLVEEATHPSALESIAHNLGEAWCEHYRKVQGIGLAKRGLAKLNLAQWNKLFPEAGFSSKLDKQISTRLGQEDRLINFAAPLMGPFGNKIETLTLPSWLAGEVDKECEPVNVLSSDGAIHFQFGKRKFVYDRLGLRQEKTEVHAAKDEDGEEFEG